MVAIKQNDKSLREFYNAINFALNAIHLKIVFTYKDIKEQSSLIAEAQKKAIRTFIVGLKLRTMRHILYGQQPKTLGEAFAITQTVFYDNEHLQLEQCGTHPKNQRQQRNMDNNPNYNAKPKHNMNWNPLKSYNNPEPMEVDNSNRMRTANNWRQPEQPQKREYNFSRQRFEQPQKMQKFNLLMETTQPLLDEADSNDVND